MIFSIQPRKGDALMALPVTTDPEKQWPGRRLLYHTAPRSERESIEQRGLDSSQTAGGLPGTYLWKSLEVAIGYARQVSEDIWVVECTGIPLEFGGPYSFHLEERWCEGPIGPERLLGRVTY